MVVTDLLTNYLSEFGLREEISDIVKEAESGNAEALSERLKLAVRNRIQALPAKAQDKSEEKAEEQRQSLQRLIDQQSWKKKK